LFDERMVCISMRFLTAGESHGPALTAIIEGLPAGLPLAADYVNEQLKRRQGGYGRGGRMAIESDRVRFLAGVRGGVTLGSPVAIMIENKDWANWQEVMAPDAGADPRKKTVTRPRPGHADLAGALKYGHKDIRNVLERASARETAAKVAVGAVARRLLEELGVEILGHVVRIGPVAAKTRSDLIRATGEFPGIDGHMVKQDQEGEISVNPSVNPSGEYPATPERQRRLDVFYRNVLSGEVLAYGLPPGLGSYTHWDRRLDGRLAHSLMSIPAIKGVEIGTGFTEVELAGSEAHDEIFYSQGFGFYRRTNRAGGLEGGVTNGEPLILRAAVKPIPTLYQPLRSVDITTYEPISASVERSDTCVVPAACVIGEAVVAWELAVACLQKFGEDTLGEISRAMKNIKYSFD